jgi:hypothetical protein
VAKRALLGVIAHAAVNEAQVQVAGGAFCRVHYLAPRSPLALIDAEAVSDRLSGIGGRGLFCRTGQDAGFSEGRSTAVQPGIHPGGKIHRFDWATSSQGNVHKRNNE